MGLGQSRHVLSESIFDKIPNEILLHIFRYLLDRDLCTISLVCRSFQVIANLDEIWKYKCQSNLNLFFSIMNKIFFRSTYKITFKIIQTNVY